MIEEMIRNRFNMLRTHLNEKQCRILAGTEALLIGRGGISIVSRATGLARETIANGCKEIKESSEQTNSSRIRRKGGGRKRTTSIDTTLQSDLESLIEPVTRGDPESPLRWTCKSIRNLASELKLMGHNTSHRMVGDMLHAMNYSLQGNKKTLEGAAHPDRNEQFEYINARVKEYQSRNQPVISVDTKKKELVGDFKNNGRELCPQGSPTLVRVHDFMIPELGKVNPYGVYDVSDNCGWVNVGIDNDTSEFAVESIRRWYNSMGKEKYPEAKELLIMADGGGSNGHRVRLWKKELQKFATETGLTIRICHFPPGTSKWNKIEHRLFSYITLNWRGKPLISHEVILSLISSTKTEAGLKVKCMLDNNRYKKGIKVSEDEFAKLNLVRDAFHGDWNYVLCPELELN